MKIRATGRWVRRGLVAAAVVASAATTAHAQEYRGVVFGHVGGANIGHADSEMGNAPVFGGGASFHLTRTLLVDADVHTGRVTHVFGRQHHDFTETTLTGSVLYRSSPDARAHFVGGGGIAVMLTRSVINEPPFPPGDRNENVRLLHARAGAEVDLSPRVMLRAEGLFWMGGGLDWVVGGRVGIGWRF